MGFAHLAVVAAFMFFPPLSAQQQTFIVQAMVTDEKAAIGAAVVVARDRDSLTLVTAAHTIIPHCTLRILDRTRRAYYEVEDVHELLDYDLAFIRVKAQDTYAVAPVAFGSATPGEPIFIWGHTDSFWKLATGSVDQSQAAIAGVFGSPRMTIDCAQCAPGDSGSGVFDAQGRLLGILTRAWRRSSGGPVLFIEVEPAALIAQEATLAFEEHATP